MINKTEATFHGQLDDTMPAVPGPIEKSLMPEPERETVGDWAGHTPKQQPETEEVFSLTMEQRPSNIITQQLLGLRPYILLRPELDENDQATFNIEVGGGAELEGLGVLLEGLGKMIQEPEAAQQIEAAVLAAQAEADDIDDTEEDS